MMLSAHQATGIATLWSPGLPGLLFALDVAAPSLDGEAKSADVADLDARRRRRA